DRSVTTAIENIAASCRHVLYLEIPTTSDFESVVDVTATDMQVHHRTGEWYRRRLDKHFVQAGAGLWVRRGGSVVLYELERTT
ncbi:MAG: class I SAM-dependent methyltransferase, partial [Actinomycetota bacterium]